MGPSQRSRRPSPFLRHLRSPGACEEASRKGYVSPRLELAFHLRFPLAGAQELNSTLPSVQDSPKVKKKKRECLGGRGEAGIGAEYASSEARQTWSLLSHDTLPDNHCVPPSTGPQAVPGGVRTSRVSSCSPGSDRDPRLWAGTAPHSSPNKSSCAAISPSINTTHVPCQTPSQLQNEKVKTQIPTVRKNLWLTPGEATGLTDGGNLPAKGANRGDARGPDVAAPAQAQAQSSALNDDVTTTGADWRPRRT